MGRATAPRVGGERGERGEVEAMAGEKVIGAIAGEGSCTAVWTEEGDVFTFGAGSWGALGHGGEETEPWPRRVEALLL